jgi:hypothetical protein
VLNSIITGTEITTSAFFICTAVSLLLGLGSAALGMFRSRYSQSFIVTLAMLPAMIQIIIMMVNGNIGAGVAVAGAFSLIRFRSAPGSAKEIGLVFLATAIGLATGMGFVVIAVVFFVIMAVFSVLLTAARFGAAPEDERELRITIPEDLEYAGLFDDIFDRYTSGAKLVRVKTTNLGSLNRLSYELRLLRPGTEKAMIDELRCRNGNLEINLAAHSENGDL